MHTMWNRKLWGTALVLLVGIAPALSDDAAAKVPTPERAAAQAAEAHASGETAALRAIAALQRPDPWLTTRHLLSEGRFDVAQAVAEAVPEGRRGGLQREVAAWRKEPEDPAVVTALERAAALLGEGKAEPAWTALEGLRARRLSSKALIAFRMARAFENARETERALSAYAVALQHASECDWPYMRAEAAFAVGRLALRARNWKDAVLHFQLAASGMRRSHSKRDLQAALFQLAHSHYEGEHYAEAQTEAAAARRLARELELGEQEANCINLLGRVAQMLGRYPEAYALHREALAIHKAAGRIRLQGSQLTNAGRNLLLMSRPDEAEAHAQEALGLAKQLASGELRGDVLHLLGEIHLHRGEGAGALDRYREALALARGSKDERRVGWSLHGMGRAYLLVEDTAAATKALKEAVELKMALRRSADAALSLGLLAEAYRRGGDAAAALEAIDIAVDFHRGTGSGHGLSQALLFRAFIQLNRRPPGDARSDLLEALELKRAARDTLGEANAVILLGQLELSSGRPERCLAKLLEARALFEKAASRPGLARVDQARARVLHDQGDHAAVLEVVGGALELLRVMQQGLREQDLIRMRQSYASLTQNGLMAAIAQADATQAFYMLEVGRAGALLRALGGRGVVAEAAFPEGAIEAERRARAAEQRAQQELVLALGKNDELGAQAARKALAASRAAIQRVIDHVKREAPGTADVLYPRPVALSAFQAQLAEHEAYVAYHLTDDRTYALVATRRTAAIHQLLPPPMLRNILARVKFDAPPLLNESGIKFLRAALLNGLKLPTGTRRLLISPDGLVGAVPFGVLLPDMEIAYVPSATTLALLSRGCTRCQKSVLALGAPEYPAGASILGATLRPLPHAAAEARAVGDVVLIGPEATVSGLRQALKRRTAWSAVHLACHAVMDPERPRRSALALTPQLPETGRLRVADVFRMKIPADLVTLSACETGIGRVERTEGIIGFTRAFMFAGSPRVLVSLWMVDDEATSALMRKFYEFWHAERDGVAVSTTGALREAQAWLRSHEKWSHPYYWGAWSLWGVAE